LIPLNAPHHNIFLFHRYKTSTSADKTLFWRGDRLKAITVTVNQSRWFNQSRRHTIPNITNIQVQKSTFFINANDTLTIKKVF